MNELIVFTITGTTVLGGAYWGYRLGGKRIAQSLFPFVMGGLLGAGTFYLGYSKNWYWPVGIISPALLGLLVYWLACGLACRHIAPKAPEERSARNRWDHFSGTLLGGSTSFLAIVAMWLCAILASNYSQEPAQIQLTDASPTPQNQAPTPSWPHSLVQVAHHGFVRHLPVAGPLSDELEAVANILQTPLETRRKYARYKQWDDLTGLSSFQAIGSNDQLIQEIEAASSGNLAALYRLQRHPQILALVSEKPIRDIITELSATKIAREMASFESKTR